MAVRNPRRQTPGQDMEAVIAVVNQLATLANELKAEVAALTAKLDADTGVADTNYAATVAVAAVDADTISVTY